MPSFLPFLILGLGTGVLGGIVGVGGGIILVPVLSLVFGFSQHLAQGTTLAALVPPVGLLAAWVYYQNGNVNITAAGWIALGFLFGGLAGAKISNSLDRVTLQRVFGTLLLIVGAKMVFFSAKTS